MVAVTGVLRRLARELWGGLVVLGATLGPVALPLTPAEVDPADAVVREAMRIIRDADRSTAVARPRPWTGR